MKTLYHAVKHVGTQTGNEQRVKNIADFFFKELRADLGKLEHTSIYVQHLGTFAVSPHKLRHTMQIIILKIRKLRREQRYEYADKMVARLSQMCKIRNELAIQMYESTLFQRAKYDRKYNQGNLLPDSPVDPR